MSRLLWMLLRFTLCAWIGAATLFVVTGVREVATTEFETTTKNHLAALRFPAFYAFGFTLVSLGLVASVVLATIEPAKRRALLAILICTVFALAVMSYDYSQVYLPLESIMLRKDRVIVPEFWDLHHQSKTLNFIALSFVLVASVISVADAPRSLNDGK